MHLEPVVLFYHRGETLSLREWRERLESSLGTIIDQSGIPLRDRLAVFNALLQNRAAVIDILGSTYEAEDNIEGPAFVL